MRVDPKLISAFHELIENGMSNETEATSTPKNNKRKSNSSDEKFVVVDKVWSLKPNRLTDHQKEKLKERRCDIPALYNNLSQSQDSVSLVEWTPKTLTTTTTSTTTSVAATVPALPASNVAAHEKNQDENVATNNTEQIVSGGEKGIDAPKVVTASEPILPKKIKFADNTVDEEDEKKKRVERELSRIHIDAVVDVVPFAAEGVVRRTRSSRSLDERPPKRKLRNETPSSAAKSTPKTIRTPIQAKAKKQTDGITRKATTSDGEASEEIVQSSQPPRIDLSSVRKKSKIRTMQGETTPPAEEAPIEESMPTIEEHLATVSDATATSKTQQENEGPVAMVKIKNETDITKEDIDMTETLTPPPAVDEVETGDIDVAPAQNDTSTASDDAQENLPSSPVSVRTGDGDGIQLGKSYMSPLEFNESIVQSRDTPNESILMSPKINDEKRNAEFLNDTLNISPIVSDTENATTNIEADSMPPCSVVIECAAMVTPKSSGDHSVRKSHSIPNATTPIDPVNRTANSMESNLPEVTPQSKVFRSSQCSTPIQTNHSPISSKFKPQTMGRGAQLLKLINSNKNNHQQQQKLCASPTMTMSAANEPATILVSTTASPSICKLQTAPIYGATVSTPEPANDTARTIKPELLTLSRPLPSPYESPRFSILKRKASRDADDDPIHSPAHKRKRVSFNFPLTETVEFLTDDEMAPIGVFAASAASNSIAHREIDALSIRSPANVKYKMKLKKRIDGAKDNHAKTANESPAPSASLTIVANKLFRDTNEDEVSVEHIKEYLEMDSNTHREKQKKLSLEGVKTVGTSIITNTADADSDAAAPSSSDCEASSLATDFMAAPSPLPTPPPITLNSFSDNEIFQHLFQKFSISDIFTKYEECKHPAIDTQLSRFFSRKLSAIMGNDGRRNSESPGSLYILVNTNFPSFFFSFSKYQGSRS